jgi:carbonic anhydrase
MDARLDLFSILGLQRGDAHIIRNAGGLVTDDAIRSLAISQRLLGTEEIVVVMHESCGLRGASEEDFFDLLSAAHARPQWRMGAFEDLEAALREGLARLRSASELPHRQQVRGLIFDPRTGALGEPG